MPYKRIGQTIYYYAVEMLYIIAIMQAEMMLFREINAHF